MLDGTNLTGAILDDANFTRSTLAAANQPPARQVYLRLLPNQCA